MVRATGSMRAYVMTRVILALPMLLILLTMVFILLRVAPGDPVSTIMGEKGDPVIMESIKNRLGLKDPWHIQFANYLRAVFTGDMGESVRTNRPVSTEVWDRFPATIELTLFGMMFASIIGILVGVMAGTHRDKPLDIGCRLYSTLIYNIPIFWLGLMLKLVFSVELGLFDFAGRLSTRAEVPPHFTGLYTIDSLLSGNIFTFFDALSHLFLPSLTLGLVLSGFFARMVRVNMLQTMQADFVEAAKARGVADWTVFYSHAFKNALVPVVTTMGLQFAILFSGAILTETVYSWEGMGRYVFWALEYRDYPAIQGAVIYYAVIMVFISVLIDIINAYIDPRIRY